MVAIETNLLTVKSDTTVTDLLLVQQETSNILFTVWFTTLIALLQTQVWHTAI